jgi:hypothetical protein
VASLHALIQANRPSSELLFSDVGMVVPNYLFIVQNERLQADAELFAAFLRATYRGFEAAVENREAAVQAIATARPDAEIDVDLMGESWDYYTSFICSDAMGGELKGRHAESDFTAAIETLRTYSGLEGGDDLDEYLTNEFFDGDDPVSEERC